MDIKNTLLTSLRQLAKQHTLETLGDRSDYLGASEIGYCPRKVILEKINPSEHDLAALLLFERGHMAEEIIGKVFTAAGFTNFEQQVEIAVDGDVPIKAHIDFVFSSETQRIKSVLEVKSTSSIPDHPYSSWESQLYFQMGVLAEQFRGHRIRGALIALDLANGEVEFYNGYAPQKIIFNGLKRKAEAIWSHYQAMLNGNEVELATEPDLLCGFSHSEKVANWMKLRTSSPDRCTEIDVFSNTRLPVALDCQTVSFLLPWPMVIATARSHLPDSPPNSSKGLFTAAILCNMCADVIGSYLP